MVSVKYEIGRGQDKDYVGKSSLLKQEIPNFEFTDIKDGIKSLYNYYVHSYKFSDK
jgi:hypothetical protein